MKSLTNRRQFLQCRNDAVGDVMVMSSDRTKDGWQPYLQAQNIVEAINANLPSGLAGLPAIPKDYVFKRHDKGVVALSLHAAFELAGGVPYRSGSQRRTHSA